MTRSFFHVPAALMDSSSVRRRSLQDEREELQRRPNRFHDMVPREFMLVGVAYTVRFLGKGESTRMPKGDRSKKKEKDGSQRVGKFCLRQVCGSTHSVSSSRYNLASRRRQ